MLIEELEYGIFVLPSGEIVDLVIREGESKPNVDLIRAGVKWVMEQDKLNPMMKSWDQGVWISKADNLCGTACCFAGHLAMDDGIVNFVKYDFFDGRTNFFETTLRDDDGFEIDIEDYATARLGLNRKDAFRLFRQSNTAQDIKEAAEEICGEKF